MKSFRLIVHQKNFSEEELIINPKDYPSAKEGDIVEIYHPEDEGPRLLLQIKTFRDDLQGKETISVEQSIASAFGLRTYADVTVRLVSPITDVVLDSVELTFKDQYMGRSEMWRLKNSLVNSCVYMNKKIEFCGNATRCQVYEMWSQGDRVACGVINDDTKVVFRSSTSMVYLFLQMSSEMWDFDIHGDLYFEKAVNGFLADLFQKWKKNGSNHEVTIVLFSRTFYDAQSLEEFPQYMRECLQQDYKGRYYEDFYRVAVQNEKYDDWSNILVQLRRLFSNYLKIVLEYHSRPDQTIPTATNSTAAQGNFLEVLNMSLNVFEKHYLDRSFDRTGQLSVVITPGVGVFEVDRELTNVTKQRIIDNGVGSDLVCVGEQPLHAVPLLKFHNKDSHISVADDYSMPHWINLSFYSSNKKVAYSNFIPRIKLPPKRTDAHKIKENVSKNKIIPEDECIHNTFFDYDAYDAQVFQLLHVHETRSLQRIAARTKKTSVTAEDLRGSFMKHTRRKMSDPDIHHNINEGQCTGTGRSQAISIPSNNIQSTSPVISPHSGNSEVKSRVWTNENVDESMSSMRAIVGSAGSPPHMSLGSAILRPGRALINPFDPSHVTIKLTSNRRRWTHIFPKGPTGVLIQQHHYQAVPTQSDKSSTESINRKSPSPCPEPFVPTTHLVRSISQVALQEYCKKRPSFLHTSSGNSNSAQNGNTKSLTLLWGATGEQEWTPALTTVNEVLIGVDWKSLTIPACLPITTDYFPDQRALQNDYVVSDYQLLPDDVNADFAQQRAIYQKPLTTAEVFRELVSQRLAQGFQLIVIHPNENKVNAKNSNIGLQSNTGSLVAKRPAETESKQEYLLSIGRIFHKISLCGSTITVTRYRPRHPYPPFNIHYQYRFHAPRHDTYEISTVSFTTEKLENYNWNYLDHYICTRGDTDFPLVEALKYWRFRVYLLPLNNSATKRIIEGSPNCDIYTSPSATDFNNHIEGFLKFIETVINKIKRPNAKKPRNTVLGNSPFRERLGSNRLSDRPRPRSGSKVMERGRVSPATDASQPPTLETPENSIEESEVSNLKSTSSFSEILEAMRHPVTGVGFLTTHPSLPSLTFVSADAVHWLVNHLDGIDNNDQAINMMNAILREHLICHASGDFTKSFVFGFYLYHIVASEKGDQNLAYDSTDYAQPLGYLQSFENEWLEVEVRSPRLVNIETPLSKALTVPNAVVDREKDVPHFLRDAIDIQYLQDLDNDYPLYKHNHLEIDISGKSDRIEWGHTKYQAVYRPDQAYELVTQWVTASGAIVSEMLFGWARKAQGCGLQMIPIPHDPLALPYSNKSDPLRGPIFVPLQIDFLIKNKTHLFEEFREDSWQDRLFLFQEAIAQKFGFVATSVETSQMCPDHQYVHSTGAMFLLITAPVQKTRSRLTSVSQRRTGAGQTSRNRYPMCNEIVPSPHEAYITRHVSGKNKNNYNESRRMGFLWAWNHMISRRWRTTQALDNTVLVRILLDFKHFCTNGDNRLQNYWEHCWEIKEDASTMPM